ncbi:MAG: ABC transporter ATP-binding protein, partial [Rhodospirillales bacterium]|nr:ABC transporter ATP-binding protein [Rhodospirillales bacterium]
MAPSAIRVEGLGKRYRRRRAGDGLLRPWEWFWALREVSFAVPEGAAFGIIGPNGAGKTTLLKILLRITEPTEGQAELRGRIGALLEVGTGFHPDLSGRDNVFLSGALLGMRRTEIAARFDEIVAFAEVGPFIDTAVKHYSSGMYVRLAFAVAAHLSAEILVADEVLAVGDIAFQNKCVLKMHEMVRSGRTVLFVSHNMAVVQKLCDHAILITDGRLVAQGPTP